jgi:hypothetical protein
MALPDRSKRKKTFKTEREARQFEAKLISSGAVGELVDPRGGKANSTPFTDPGSHRDPT